MVWCVGALHNISSCWGQVDKLSKCPRLVKIKRYTKYIQIPTNIYSIPQKPDNVKFLSALVFEGIVL